MKSKIIKITAALIAIFGFANALSATPVLAAECKESDPDACAINLCKCRCVSESIKKASGCDEANSNTTVDNVAANILYATIGILGVIAVIVIIYGGVQYIISAGDVGKVKKAKDTILYAVIGLIVCALAFAIVNFTIGAVQDTPSNNTAQNGEATSYLPLEKSSCNF